MFEHLDTNDLVEIAAAGGGFETRAGFREVSELVRIAAAAGQSGARLVFVGLNHLSRDEIVQIAVPGNGNVFFKKD